MLIVVGMELWKYGMMGGNLERLMVVCLMMMRCGKDGWGVVCCDVGL